VLEGECEWQVGDQLVRANPGPICSCRPACLTTSPTPATSPQGCS
jgi:hypothetical protein